MLIPRLVKGLLFAEMLGKAIHGDALKGLRVQYEAISVISNCFCAISCSVHQVVFIQSPLAVLVSDPSVSGKLHESFGSFPAESRTFLGAYVTVIGVLGVFVCGFKCSHAGLLSGS